MTVPELDYKYVGTVNISLSDSSLTEALMASFQYVLPPKPVIHADSVVIAENQGLWAPASAKGYPGSFVVKNLSPKYGIQYDELQVFFGGKPAVVKSYLQLGLNAKVSFTTPDKMSPGFSSCNVTILLKGNVAGSVLKFGDATPFIIEFRLVSLELHRLKRLPAVVRF